MNLALAARIGKLLQDIEHGKGQAGDIEVLEEMTHFLGPGKTFCPHAPGAMEPLQSALKFFRGEFERGIVNTAAQYEEGQKAS